MAAELKHVVVSAVNFVSGGPLSVLRDALGATGPWADSHRFTALVHHPRVLEGLPEHVEHRAFPDSKKSWLRRLRYEYRTFAKLSRELRPHLWLSLHDVTPNVTAEHRAVYCHNPAPFHRLKPSDLWLAPKLVAFRLFYPTLYRKNLHANDAVIVQQDWMRGEFVKRYGVRNVVVAHPRVPEIPIPRRRVTKGQFVYPALPRVFKNVETACAAFEELAGTDARLVLTIDGRENAYARKLKRRFGKVKSIEFVGLKPREEVYELYARSEALVFPSVLETWGLPLSEFRQTGKPIFAADLPYAHESLSGYEAACFFDPHAPRVLAQQIRRFLADDDHDRKRVEVNPTPPFAEDWGALWRYLLEELTQAETSGGRARRPAAVRSARGGHVPSSGSRR